MIFFIIYVISTLCLLLAFLYYKEKDEIGIVSYRVWAFLEFLSFIPILNTIMLVMLMWNSDIQEEDSMKTLEDLQELDRKLEELFNSFK